MQQEVNTFNQIYTAFTFPKSAEIVTKVSKHLWPNFISFDSSLTLEWTGSVVFQQPENHATSTLTAYLTPYATLVHQGKGTKYSR